MTERPTTNMERETGIEPATNSLEGCDSTTELLPPTLPTLTGRLTRYASLLRLIIPTRCLANPELAERAEMVAREGLEPSKPLGRQIYSLLRLTASLPRQLSVVWNALRFDTYPRRKVRRWSWRRDLNPRPADYKSAAL